MADFSSRDIEKLIEIWEEEEDLWNISRENYHKKEARANALERLKEGLKNDIGKDCSGK